MGFEQLLQEKKTVEITHGETSVSVTLRKWPYGFAQWANLKAFEGKDVSEGKVSKAGEFEPLQDLQALRIVKGISKWSLDEEITEKTVKVLLNDYPGFADKLMSEIGQFNRMDAEKKK